MQRLDPLQGLDPLQRLNPLQTLNPLLLASRHLLVELKAQWKPTNAFCEIAHSIEKLIPLNQKILRTHTLKRKPDWHAVYQGLSIHLVSYLVVSFI